MKTKRRAYDMLKRNRKESWAYLLTLTLSASLLLVFINIQNDINFLNQVTNVKDPVMKFTSSIALGGTTLVIAGVCAINCYVANTYFLKAKSQELCVYLSSGMNIVVLAKYLIAQNVMILLAALPIGAILATVMNPIVNLIIYHVLDLSGSLFTMSWKGIFIWLLIQLIEIIYLFLINIGFAYKAELKDLLDEHNIAQIPDVRMMKLPAITYPIMCLLAFIGLLISPVDVSYYSFCILFAFSGVSGFFLHYLPSLRDKKIAHRKHLEPEKMILSGNFHALLKSSYMYILMIFLLVVGMSCLMVDGLLMPYVRVILAVAYILLLILMCASLYFKIMLEANKRKLEFAQLALVGLPIEHAAPILKKEIMLLFSYCIIMPLPFLLYICYQFIAVKQMTLAMGSFILCSYVVILLIVGVLSNMFYQKVVIKSGGEQYEQSN